MPTIAAAVCKCTYLTGDNVAPKTAAQARALIGKRVTYLQRENIDTTGRGLFFPRNGVVVAVTGKNIAIDNPQNFVIQLGNLVEMVLVPEA